MMSIIDTELTIPVEIIAAVVAGTDRILPMHESMRPAEIIVPVTIEYTIYPKYYSGPNLCSGNVVIVDSVSVYGTGRQLPLNNNLACKVQELCELNEKERLHP